MPLAAARAQGFIQQPKAGPFGGMTLGCSLKMSGCPFVPGSASAEVTRAEPRLWITGMASGIRVAGRPKSPASSAGDNSLLPTASLRGEDAGHEQREEAEEAARCLRWY